eukprot:m.71210 g.71210  ORF g.71210 m.71210 type:complete len:459 (-) comp8693_c0_seq1:205-1581(-)
MMAGAGGDGQNETFMGRIKDTSAVVVGKKKFTMYLVEVTPPWFYNVPSYTVHRRYREFLALYKDVCAVFGKKEVNVVFPKKKAMGSMTPGTVLARRAGLQSFLDMIGGHEKMGKHKIVQDFMAHRPGMDPPKPPPGSKKGSKAVSPAVSIEPQEAPKEGHEKVVVAGSRSGGAAAAMRVAAATPGMPGSSSSEGGAYQPPTDYIEEDEDVKEREARKAAKAEAEKKARIAAEAERARARAEHERKLKLEAEAREEAARKVREEEEAKAKAQAERAAKAAAQAQSQKASSGSSTPAATSPAAAAPKAAPVTEWPTLPGLSSRLVKEADRSLTGGDFGGAAEGFDEAIGSLESLGTEFDIVRTDLYVKRADCLLHDGRARVAAEELSKALELTPNHPEALLRRARAQQQREKFRDSFTDFQACVLLKASNEQTARSGLREVVKLLEQTGDGSWVRQNRRV